MVYMCTYTHMPTGGNSLAHLKHTIPSFLTANDYQECVQIHRSTGYDQILMNMFFFPFKRFPNYEHSQVTVTYEVSFGNGDPIVWLAKIVVP